jgi:NADH:ubiquinone reductase (H+-translocating)
VARILGVNFSGFDAWWLWRTIHLLKLTRFEKKLRVALDWTLDLFFSKDFVQYLHERSPVFSNAPSNRLSDQPGNDETASISSRA